MLVKRLKRGAETEKYHNKYRINSVHLKGWDYTAEGYYFAAICTKGYKGLLGKENRGQIEISKPGKIADACWMEITKCFNNTRVDEYCIMPDHAHDIIEITCNICRDVALVRRSFMTAEALAQVCC